MSGGASIASLIFDFIVTVLIRASGLDALPESGNDEDPSTEASALVAYIVDDGFHVHKPRLPRNNPELLLCS